MSYCNQICLFLSLVIVNDVASQNFHWVYLIYFSFLFAVLINDGVKSYIFSIIQLLFILLLQQVSFVNCTHLRI